MKLMLWISMLCFSILGNAQTYQFLPDWEVGDVKKIKVFQQETEYRPGLDPYTRIDSSAGPIYTVTEEADDYFILSVEKIDETLDQISMFLDGYAEAMGDTKEIPVELRISKVDGSVDIHNFEALKVQMDKKLEVINKLLEEKGKGLMGMMQDMIAPIAASYEDTEALKANYFFQSGFIIAPFIHEYEKGKVFEEDLSGPNPLKPDTEISMQRTIQLANIDKDAGMATFHQETEFDLDAYMEMIKDLMMKMGSAFGQSEESKEKHEKELEDFEIELDAETNIYFNINSTWVEKAVTKMVFEGIEPGKGKRKSVVEVTYIIE